MIYSITGLLRQVAPTYCVIEACGIGYQCSASTYTLSSLPGRGQEVTLLTHLWVKEDGMELFGFSTEQEKHCFRLLIGVSGVGPRVALAILSDAAPDRLMLSIAAGDAKALTRAQGVGAKLAQRIILELRDKVTDEDIGSSFGEEQGTIAALGESAKNTAKSEAISALVALGYGQTDAAAVIAPMEESLAVDELIRRALKTFTRSK
jgi:Holliday junction DNA helicase RuvA